MLSPTSTVTLSIVKAPVAYVNVAPTPRGVGFLKKGAVRVQHASNLLDRRPGDPPDLEEHAVVLQEREP